MSLAEENTSIALRAPDGCMCSATMTCICSPTERGLRAILADGGMTDEERQWCLDQIEQVEEHKSADFVAASDSDLARGVLDAWTDFCRDKGML